MDGRVNCRHYVRYWSPDTLEEIGCEVGSVAEVQEIVNTAAKIYRRANVQYFPGVSVWRSINGPVNSLTLAISSDGCAIVHTNEDFFQKVTYGGLNPEKTYRRVQLDDFLEIPSRCFIEESAAFEIVAHWMAWAKLPSNAKFSEELFEL